MEDTNEIMRNINANLDNMLFDMKAHLLQQHVKQLTDKQFLMIFGIMLEEHKRRFR